MLAWGYCKAINPLHGWMHDKVAVPKTVRVLKVSIEGPKKVVVERRTVCQVIKRVRMSLRVDVELLQKRPVPCNIEESEKAR